VSTIKLSNSKGKQIFFVCVIFMKREWCQSFSLQLINC